MVQASPEQRSVIVIGAGAAGLMAAGQAAGAGARVVLLEKKARPGRKLRITGKGRGNLTNVAPLAEFIAHFGRQGRFLHQAFARFFSDDLIAFFDSIGVPTRTERGGRVFLQSEQAGDLVDALSRWVEGQGVLLRPGVSAKQLARRHGRVVGVTTEGGERLEADAVIIATGGASYPATGSTGDGYRLAQNVGHRIVPIRPALVPLITGGKIARRLSGLTLRNVGVRLRIDGEGKASLQGEVRFTDTGLSGPVILTLSKQVVDALRAGERATISIDLKPALDFKKLDARLLREIDQHGRSGFGKLLKRLLPARLIPICSEQLAIALHKPAHQILADERARLLRWLKGLDFTVVDHGGFREAIVTAGGVSLDEIDPRSMRSRQAEGLYLAGEVLDLDGDTGGYNLQAAFSTGWLAGQGAARRP